MLGFIGQFLENMADALGRSCMYFVTSLVESKVLPKTMQQVPLQGGVECIYGHKDGLLLLQS